MDPRYNPWATPMFPNTGSAFGVGSPAEAAERQPTFVDSLLSHIAGALGRGFMAPGRALQSTEPITTEQMIKPAADIAGSMTLGAGAIPADLNALRMGIKAYHGSPHDFDRFDISKIGTGEGAQAYGHGLYFAEGENVAKSYRDALSRDTFLINGEKRTMPGMSPELRQAAQAIDQYGSADAAKAYFSQIPGSEVPRWIDKASELGIGVNKGKMYEVNLNADPAHFLDWDKPINAQGGRIDQTLYDVLGRSGIDKDYTNYILNNKTGQDAFRSIGAKTPDPAAASQVLNQAGIPGIRYLDQGSRGVPAVNGRVQAIGGGGGFNIVDDFGVQAGPFPTLAEAKQYLDPGKNLSSNYVMFDDKLIDILRKYGIAGMTAPPIFANAMSEQKQ